MVGVNVIVASVLWSLALLLLASGVAKLLTRKTDDSALNVMALPALVDTRATRTALPWVEILLALALVLSSGIVLWAATAATVVLFAAFTVFVSIGVRQGDPASCGCFGSWSRAPMSWRTIVRNLVFVALATIAFLAASTGSYPGPALPLPWWTVVAAAVPLVVIGVIVWAERGAPTQQGLRAAQLSTLAPLPQYLNSRETTSRPSTAEVVDPAVTTHPGDAAVEEDNDVRLPIPLGWAVDGKGQRVSLRIMAHSQARALFYVGPECDPCLTVIHRLRNIPHALGPVALHTVVSHEDVLRALPESLRPNALVDPDRSLAGSLGMVSTPWAVVLGADGLLAGGPVAGGPAVGRLLNELLERFDTAPRS